MKKKLLLFLLFSLNLLANNLNSTQNLDSQSFLIHYGIRDFTPTLQNGNATPQQKQQAYTALVGYISQEMGVTSTQAKLIIADNIKGGVFSQDNQNIYLVDNDRKNLGTSAGAVEVLGHEVSHYLDFIKDKNLDKTSEYKDNRENYAHLIGDATLDYTNFNYTVNGYNALHTVINRQNYENQDSIDSLLNQNALEFNSLDTSKMDGFLGKAIAGIATGFLGMLEAPRDEIPDISDTQRFTEFALNVVPMGFIGGVYFVKLKGKAVVVSKEVYDKVSKVRIDIDPNVISSGGFGGIKIGIKYINPPKFFKAFPDLKTAKRKTSVQGGSKLRERWKDKKGNIYEWDYQHGTLEKYNKRGKHLGEFDAQTGEQLKLANKTRSVEP
ncbi:MAG: Putative hemolysin, containing Haemagluttinin repeat [uncultured Campylobacterales bacterium]|uniref:Hemolysin, containing Haemagluttinin repeat n=1 Tax=uncultured Campylobacterales bacterium TaxID=352960 RepID=A0A6S6SMC1_9BACT|nr:MAG: Putative hemolysin, containing Haemagluttinin repeat [uncultured Campylobacterales bacterium]